MVSEQRQEQALDPQVFPRGPTLQGMVSEGRWYQALEDSTHLL